MNASLQQGGITSLETLESQADDANQSLTDATNRNQLLDAARKDLKPALSKLKEVVAKTAQSTQEAETTKGRWQKDFHSPATDQVHEARTAADKAISEKAKSVETATKNVDAGRKDLADKRQALTEASKELARAQEALKKLPDDIRAKQKKLKDLEMLIEASAPRKLIVETVVGLEDLDVAIAELQTSASTQNRDDLWNTFSKALDATIAADRAVRDSTVSLVNEEEAFKAATAAYDNATKSRLEDIKSAAANDSRNTNTSSL